ncbi:hypothetical protein E2C01_062436 [Portunus trituberculatus]|uniref:Uncharacterized protein n=1 Tax=Portunus trituberculatus TaxID=210409 RepID=A0A5B7HE15_PORTR|nr:hypothetical protein [Portunus trituberculatus]
MLCCRAYSHPTTSSSRLETASSPTWLPGGGTSAESQWRLRFSQCFCGAGRRVSVGGGRLGEEEQEEEEEEEKVAGEENGGEEDGATRYIMSGRVSGHCRASQQLEGRRQLPSGRRRLINIPIFLNPTQNSNSAGGNVLTRKEEAGRMGGGGAKEDV